MSTSVELDATTASLVAEIVGGGVNVGDITGVSFRVGPDHMISDAAMRINASAYTDVTN